MSIRNRIKSLVKEIVKITLKEWDAVAKQENILKHSLIHNQGRLRGIKLTNAQLDTSYFKQDSGEIEILVKHDYSFAETSRAFGKGRLVDVILSGQSQKWAKVPGIVSGVQDNSMTIQVSSIGDNFLLPHFSDNSLCKVSITKRSSDEIMKWSVEALQDIKVKNPGVAQMILEDDIDIDEFSNPVAPIFMQDGFLDQDKIEAVNLCSQRFPITVIHGPPGTGKTTALAAAILSEVANGSRVLATSPSHAAVDALTLAILKQWNEDILGPKNSLKQWNEDILGPKNSLLRVGKELRIRDQKVKPWLPKSLNPEDYEELHLLRETMIHSKMGKNTLQNDETEIRSRLQKAARKGLQDQILQNRVVTATCLTAMNWSWKILQSFDVICIDEAAFAPDWLTFPLALSNIPRLIMSGDHLQLPPVTVSDMKLTSLMERLIYKVPSVTLTQQFRSNSVISGWSSKVFYKNKLKAHESVQDILLSDLVVGCKNERLERPLLFYDTFNLGCHEQENSSLDGSICNPDEAYIVGLVVQSYKDLGVKSEDIGIITPYWSQVALLRDMFKDDLELDISTVDGFQGCEKEMIIVSFVRSNPKCTVGFLSESRRINVTVTRAKRCCVIVGDVKTLSSDKCLKSLIDYCKKNECIISADKYIQ